MEKNGRKALHRGLKALLSGTPAQEEEAKGSQEQPRAPGNDIPVKDVLRNPFQPRMQFDPEEMEGLKASIRTHGVIEPIIVRRSKGAFEIISGERRFRAVKELGYETIPAIIREKTSDREMRNIALVENLQRADLNDVEVAASFQEQINSNEYTHEQLAQDMGKSRSFVTNTLRLLKLPEHMKDALLEKKMTAGHARALLSLEDPDAQEILFKRILVEGISVRQTEEFISGKKKEKKTGRKEEKSFDLVDLENSLNTVLGTKVVIRQSGKKGKIVIAFTTMDDLNRIVSIIRKE